MIKALREKLIAYQRSNCTDCSISEKRTSIVPCRGYLGAKIAGVGEAPGKFEEIEGKTFIGPAGKLLDECASYAGIDTNEHTLLVNTVMCRPHPAEGVKKENRAPTPEEIQACLPKLKDLINTLNPRLIVLFGAPAMTTCLPNAPSRITQVAGKFFPPSEHIFDVDADAYVMLHPSYILRNRGKRNEFIEAFIRMKHYAVGAEILRK